MQNVYIENEHSPLSEIKIQKRIETLDFSFDVASITGYEATDKVKNKFYTWVRSGMTDEDMARELHNEIAQLNSQK